MRSVCNVPGQPMQLFYAKILDFALAVTFSEPIEIVLISVTSYATDQLIAKLLADHADHAPVVASCASSDSW